MLIKYNYTTLNLTTFHTGSMLKDRLENDSNVIPVLTRKWWDY